MYNTSMFSLQKFLKTFFLGLPLVGSFVYFWADALFCKEPCNIHQMSLLGGLSILALISLLVSLINSDRIFKVLLIVITLIPILFIIAIIPFGGLMAFFLLEVLAVLVVFYLFFWFLFYFINRLKKASQEQSEQNTTEISFVKEYKLGILFFCISLLYLIYKIIYFFTIPIPPNLVPSLNLKGFSFGRLYILPDILFITLPFLCIWQTYLAKNKKMLAKELSKFTIVFFVLLILLGLRTMPSEINRYIKYQSIYKEQVSNDLHNLQLFKEAVDSNDINICNSMKFDGIRRLENDKLLRDCQFSIAVKNEVNFCEIIDRGGGNEGNIQKIEECYAHFGFFPVVGEYEQVYGDGDNDRVSDFAEKHVWGTYMNGTNDKEAIIKGLINPSR